LLLATSFTVALAGCERVAADSTGAKGQSAEPEKKGPPVRFAEDREPMEVKAIPFDGKRAMPRRP